MSGKKLLEETITQGTAGLIREVLQPGVVPLGATVKVLAELINNLALPIEILNARIATFRRGMAEGVRRKPDHTAADLAKGWTALSRAPIHIEKSLEEVWRSLISAAVADPRYHPVLPSILSELSGTDLRLLKHLIEYCRAGRELSPNIVATRLPADFYTADGAVDYQRLAISFTALEKQSLISTANNLGAFFRRFSELSGEPQLIDPTGHQVTALGYLLHEVSGRGEGT